MHKLQKRLALLETDIAVHREQIDSLSSEAEAFIAAGHFDSRSIASTLEALVGRYKCLQVR